MQTKALLLLALCLMSLPALYARDVLEDADDVAIAALLETGSVFSTEQQMLMAAGAYGNSIDNMGSYGGLFTGGLESGSQDTSSISNTASNAAGTLTNAAGAAAGTASSAAAGAAGAAGTAAAAVKSAAMPADKSLAVLGAGVLVAVSALLL